jgi:leader peptidase (prepilin peptidase)/N-methyltransferase
MNFITEPVNTWSLLLLFLAAASFMDVKRGVIPNPLVALAAVVGVTVCLANGGEIGHHLLAGLLAGGGLLVLSAVYDRLRGTPGFGMGDVKAVGAIGLMVGWPVMSILVAACALGTLTGFLGIITRRLTLESRIPFAPFMLVGALLVFICGTP